MRLRLNIRAGIEYPFWCHDHRWSWLLHDFSKLEEVELNYLKSKALQKMKFIDKKLNFFEVADVEVVSRAGLLGWKPGYKGVYFNVRLTLCRIKQLAFVDAKNYVLEFISQHPKIYESGIGLANVKSKIENSKNMDSLFRVL